MRGVAIEAFSDPLVLTTQFEASWYRYTMRWKFYLDGRIQPIFGFSSVSSECVGCTRKHHAYWRLDFDIDSAAGNIVTEGPVPPPGGGRSGLVRPRSRSRTRPCGGRHTLESTGP